MRRIGFFFFLETGELKLGPSEQDSVEFGPDHLQQLRVEKVLTQAEGAPVTGAHAAQSGVAAERRTGHTHTHKRLVDHILLQEQQSADWNTSRLIQKPPEKGVTHEAFRKD